ncbi:MAG: DUF1456 family protein [Spirochaetales bacterium]|jgi:uncharacterized protein YehS (DUF1456 family)|nr:DUF1456 family protein [Spirochaetales bacterium]
MNSNDIFRRLRYALKLSGREVFDLVGLAGLKTEPEEGYFKKEGEEGFVPCPQAVLGAFLDGLILRNRGPRKEGPPALGEEEPAKEGGAALNNNRILKKIRIALELQEEDMLKIFETGGFPLSRGELSALFRKESHKNYKPAQDQILKKFLNGLTKECRNQSPEASCLGEGV